MENLELRALARERGVPLWLVGRRLGVSEATVTRWLRLPLTGERREAFVRAIEKGGEQNAAESG